MGCYTHLLNYIGAGQFVMLVCLDVSTSFDPVEMLITKFIETDCFRRLIRQPLSGFLSSMNIQIVLESHADVFLFQLLRAKWLVVNQRCEEE